ARQSTPEELDNPTMADDPAVRGLFGKLDTQLKANQHKKALKTADDILKAAPGDQDALRVRALLLIEVESFEEALRAASSPALQEPMVFEKAYCLYRLGRLQEALSALQQDSSTSGSSTDQAVARLQLEAQLHYRLGAPKEAIRQYNQLFQQYGVSGMEVRTNVVAAYLAGGRAEEVPAVMEAMKMSPQDGFEVAFNAACALIEAGSLREAEKQLQLAQRVGEEALYEEELGDDEVAQELAPVSAQLAYVAARLGRSQEAAAAYEALLKRSSLADDATAAVAASNLAALAAPEEGGDGGGGGRKAAAEGFRRLEGLVERAGGVARLKRGLDSRLGAAQREALLSNYAALALMAGKADAAKDGIRGLEKAAPSSPALPLLQASHLAADKKALAEACAVLQAAQQQQAGAGAGASGREGGLTAGLMRVQLLAAAGEAQQALAVLQALPGVQSKPGVVATQATLLQQAGDLAGAAALLSQALQQQKPGSSGATWLLSRLAAVELRSGDLPAAQAHLQQLLEALPAGTGASGELLPRYARVAALCDPAGAAGALPAQLPKAPAMAPRDVDALENASVALTSDRRRGTDSGAAVPVPAALRKREAEGGDVEKPKKKRKRRKKLPKGYDPANPPPPPDPERWLPKWERSDAKRKHKKKHRDKEAVKGSQGAGKVDESLDRTNAPDVDMDDATKPKLPPKPAGVKGKKGKARR
ncbi:hypothetical protein N2152v2_004562, partial [Parachlorella kessleri]